MKKIKIKCVKCNKSFIVKNNEIKFDKPVEESFDPGVLHLSHRILHNRVLPRPFATCPHCNKNNYISISELKD